MDKSRYYHPSGTAPVGGIISGLIMSLAAAFVLGALYGVIDHYNPLIYVNFLGALGLGAVIGTLVSSRVKKGKIRSRNVARLMGIVTGLAGLYCAWIGFVAALTNWELILVDPLQLSSFIQEMALIGVWELKGHQPTGLELYSIWAIEAGVVLYFTYKSSLDNEIPYCEDCDEWTQPKLADLHVPLRETSLLTSELEAEDYEGLLTTCSQPVEDANHLVLTVNGCENCETHYLKVDHVKPNAKNDGVDTKTIAPWLKTNGQVLDAIEERAAQAAAARPVSPLEQLVPNAPTADPDSDEEAAS